MRHIFLPSATASDPRANQIHSNAFLSRKFSSAGPNCVLMERHAISTARKIAYEVLLRVEAEGAYASDVLHIQLGAQIKPADAALATEITMGVLRWRRFLDCLLDPLLKKPAAHLDLPVAIALRMGLYQLRFLQRVPPSAAVNESVELVKMARKVFCRAAG